MTEESKEFERAQYVLRASFYYREHSKWQSLKDLVRGQAIEAGLNVDLSNIEKYGISKRAANRVSSQKVEAWKVFAHPDILRNEPRLIAYYRCMALLPQKGLQQLAFGTAALETRGGNLSEERALKLANVLNGLVSMVVESDPGWTYERAEVSALLNLGSQINGSWRNAIGEEGGREVKTLLSTFLSEEGLLSFATLSDNSTRNPPLDAEAAATVRSLTAINGHTIHFASEPDVAVRDAGGVLQGTIEIKYGTDRAGALERYGAAKKSFEEAVRQSARVQNVYLANVITDEVRKRISQDRLVSEAYELRKIAVDGKERDRFLNFVKRRMLDL